MRMLVKEVLSRIIVLKTYRGHVFFMVVISELGTDINSNWSFTDGDLNLISDKENLIQATRNRLNNVLDSLDDFYLNYGSILWRFIGWKSNDMTLKFMEIELENCLNQDPRLTDYTLDLSYGASDTVNINIFVVFDDETEFDMNYILSTDGVVEEY